MSRRYDVVHRTVYRYDDDVTASYGRAYLVPRDTPWQWREAFTVDVRPAPVTVTESSDFYGNRCLYLEVHAAHRELVVTAASRVRVARPAVDLAVLSGWTWERAAAAAAELDDVQARDFRLPSAQVGVEPPVRAYAAGTFTPDRPVGEAVRELVARIHRDFAYTPGVTSVTTTMPQVLAARAGVCQDFAHLAVACLRGVGLPARYVSGYLETQPPPGRPKLRGADASHAWASVLLPELGWVDVDPTNDRVVDESYVVTAWGRDYTDVPPVKGVIFTESTRSTLHVAVDVIAVEEDGDPPGPSPADLETS